ncbi:hypothetical protein ABPG75_000455 [Micractinium tetrahymenae]
MRLFGGARGGVCMRHASQEEATLLDARKKGRGRGRGKAAAARGTQNIALMFQKASTQQAQQAQRAQQEEQPSQQPAGQQLQPSQQQTAQRAVEEQAARQQQQQPPRLAELEADVQVGVLQRLYVELCRQHDPGQYVAQGLEARPGVLSEVDRQEVKRVRQWIEKCKRRGYQPHDFAPCIERRVLEQCQREARRQNVIDYSDMLALVVKLLRENSAVLERLRRLHTHILVDEFQDCNLLQVELVMLLGGQSGRITAVGDDDQSIYSFMAATPDVFNLFQKALADEPYGQEATVLHLQTNYRSTRSILKVGAALLATGSSRRKAGLAMGRRPPGSGKQLRPAQVEPGAPVSLTIFGTPEDEARGIAEAIAACVAAGTLPASIAVLFRYFNLEGKTYFLLQRELERLGIPHKMIRQKPILEYKAVQLVVAYMGFLLNDADDTRFQEMFVERPKLGVTSERKLLELQASRQLEGQMSSLLQCAREVSSSGSPASKLLRAPQRQAVAALLADVERLRREMRGLRPAELLDRVLDAAGLYEKARLRRERRRAKGLEGSSDVEGGSSSDSGSDNEEDGEDRPPASQQQQQQQQQPTQQAEQQHEDAGQPALVAGGTATQPSSGREEGATEAEKGPYRMRLSGPLKVLQREATAFPAGAWQPRMDDYREALVAALAAAAAAEAAAGAGLHRAGPATAAAAQEAAPVDGEAGEDEEAVLLSVAGGAQLAELRAALECRGPLLLQEFLAYMVADADSASPLDGGVCISTIHSAKGLEWDVVFSPRWHEGFLPHEPRLPPEGEDAEVRPALPASDETRRPTLRMKDSLGEEGQRLAHVAATRARLEHHISFPDCFEPSRYLRDVLELYRAQPGVLQVERR